MDEARALREAWLLSDRLFAMLEPGAWASRPLPLRHPVLFYVGHLPAFAWRHLAVGQLGLPALDPVLDRLFERGIDPATAAEARDASPEAWPDAERVLAYRDAVRQRLGPRVEGLAADPRPVAREAVAMVLEHELMHHETLMYMLARVDPSRLQAPEGWKRPRGGAGSEPVPVQVSGGPVALGADRVAGRFGWCCEHPRRVERVADFVIDSVPVTVGRFLPFVQQGGYGDPRWWPADRPARSHPVNWRRAAGRWQVRSLLAWHDLDDVSGWPVQVSFDEALAWARWARRRLPTEAELHRAAFYGPSGEERAVPWAGGAPSAVEGAFDFRVQGPVPVGSRPTTTSVWGVEELVGNGWEWSATPFVAWPGFEAHLPTYPGYSADFFDGMHHVVFGASWATHARLIRRSFRNWYRRDYPYVFATFRTVAQEPR